jgi:hypothetical protein
LCNLMPFRTPIILAGEHKSPTENVRGRSMGSTYFFACGCDWAWWRRQLPIWIVRSSADAVEKSVKY